MFALVLIEYSVKAIDKTFTYKVPDNLKDKLKKGMKVKVEFGSQELNGFVLDITNTYNGNYELKEIKSITDEELIINEELMQIALYLSGSTLCTKISAFQTMLPASLKIKNQNSNYKLVDKYIELISDNYKNVKLNNTQKIIIDDLLKLKKVLKKNYSVSSVKTLIKNNVIKEIEIQKYRIDVKNNQEKSKTLTESQNEVYETITKYINSYNTFLLHGVTGSGKTEVYIKLIESVLKSNKTALLLVPEISLTAQITKRFYQIFGSDVAIFHSALSTGEKNDEYLKILRGEVKIVVGTRSSVFAPLKNLGIIIIDEEHSSSYKQENTPKYNAIDIAKKRCEINNIPLILGSATPLLETKARADKGVYKLLTLDKRVGKALLPQIHVIDMAKEMKKRNTIFSSLLIDKIKNRLEKKEQVILLLNRRGHSTFVSCSNCGYIYKCPNCDISLTYHKTNNNLICHYCGYLTKKSSLCPKCKEDSLNFLGLGTEKLEEKLKKLFPEARIVRMDQDTTSKKGSHEKIITDFQNEEYDILLGTQMISKGLDFPKVSLVGIINADTTLNIPDFRSGENTFSLLSQTSGRAGRSDILGEVIIQTFNPDNYVITCVKNNDYNSFYKKEMSIRQVLKYPPYYYLISVSIIGKNYEKTLEEAKIIKKYIEKNKEENTIVLGPTTAAILKFNNEYRFNIMIKYKYDNVILKSLKTIDEEYALNKNVRIDIDINPYKI